MVKSICPVPWTLQWKTTITPGVVFDAPQQITSLLMTYTIYSPSTVEAALEKESVVVKLGILAL
jgi:hypothetical protein